MSLTIRPFKADDLPALQRLRQAAFKPVFGSFRQILGEEIYRIALADSDLQQAKLLDELCKAGSAHDVFVAEDEGVIAGFVTVSLDREKRVGEIGLNAVHPDHAGKGAGTKMYAFALERMKVEGMAVATVGTGGDPSHAAARRAYAKAGFGPALPSVFLYKRL